MRRRKRAGKRVLPVLMVLLCLAVLGAGLLLCVDFHVRRTGEARIIAPDAATELTEVDCILILGCGVREDGTPSHMLADRLRRGVELYNAGAAPKLLMSGDHGRAGYNEVGAMKDYAVEAGIPSEDVFMDHAGFSTYESLYRAKEIFGVERVLIVTQEYHLYRALYIAQQMGLEAWGVDADYRAYAGQTVREAREVLARVKDYVTTLYWPEPTYLGEAIPVSGNGDITNGEGKE